MAGIRIGLSWKDGKDGKNNRDRHFAQAMKTSPSVFSHDQFFSIVIPAFFRPEMLKKVIESIHEHADMHFELIVNDDGSSDETQEILFANRHKLSTLILNCNKGRNMGIPVSANRMVACANSRYILFMNADCVMTGPSLVALKNILDKEYVGYLCLEESNSDGKPYIIHRGTTFKIKQGTGGGAILAFRKDIWEKVGGFNEQYPSHSVDASFMHKLISYGYFRVGLCGPMRFKNLDRIVVPDSSMGRSGFDVCYPKIFGIPQDMLDRFNKQREKVLYSNCDTDYHIPEKYTNDVYWHQYTNNLMDENNQKILWENGIKHNHIQWKEQVEKDLNNSA